jgi:hypothetical protein
MTGAIVAGGTRLSVNVSDSWLLGLRTATCEQQIGPEIVAADYHIPYFPHNAPVISPNYARGRVIAAIMRLGTSFL